MVIKYILSFVVLAVLGGCSGYSPKFGYVSAEGVFTLLAVVAVLAGLQWLYQNWRLANYVPTELDNYMWSLAYQAERLHQEIAGKDESLDRWAKDHLIRRVMFLKWRLEPLVKKELIDFRGSIKAEDLVLVTRFLDLLYYSADDLGKKQREVESEMKRYLAKLSDDELRSFTLRKMIRSCVLNHDIDDPEANRKWTQIRGEYEATG